MCLEVSSQCSFEGGIAEMQVIVRLSFSRRCPSHAQMFNKINFIINNHLWAPPVDEGKHCWICTNITVIHLVHMVHWGMKSAVIRICTLKVWSKDILPLIVCCIRLFLILWLRMNLKIRKNHIWTSSERLWTNFMCEYLLGTRHDWFKMALRRAVESVDFKLYTSF